MSEKKFLGGNKEAILVTLIVIAAATTALYTQGYFRWEKLIYTDNPVVFREMKLKIVFDGDDPELMAVIPEKKLSGYQTMMGDPVPGVGSIVLGYDESRDMALEKNITISEALWGYTIDDFLGRSLTVTGSLKKTNSLIDMMHILHEDTFNQFGPGERIDVKLTEEKMPKFFYLIQSDNSNWPEKAKFASGSFENFTSVKEDWVVVDFTIGQFNLKVSENKTYIPMVLGSSEAEMMIEEGKFTSVGDRMANFFGEDVYVAGILEPTGTVLDMLHYIPAE